MNKLRAAPGVVKTGLLAFWCVHGTWGFVVSLPVILGNAAEKDGIPALNWVDGLGFALWAVGVIMESTA
eukprot:SAG31_NODE_12063_length_972_cov_0.939290_1_plen_68_part_10